MSETNRTAMDEAMGAHAAMIHSYLAQIADRVADHPAPESPGLNWGHVGDLERIENELAELVDSIRAD